jgi:hypothetical protein
LVGYVGSFKLQVLLRSWITRVGLLVVLLIQVGLGCVSSSVISNLGLFLVPDHFLLEFIENSVKQANGFFTQVSSDYHPG